jgi:hypothetical protein
MVVAWGGRGGGLEPNKEDLEGGEGGGELGGLGVKRHDAYKSAYILYSAHSRHADEAGKNKTFQKDGN